MSEKCCDNEESGSRPINGLRDGKCVRKGWVIIIVLLSYSIVITLNEIFSTAIVRDTCRTLFSPIMLRYGLPMTITKLSHSDADDFLVVLKQVILARVTRETHAALRGSLRRMKEKFYSSIVSLKKCPPKSQSANLSVFAVWKKKS